MRHKREKNGDKYLRMSQPLRECKRVLKELNFIVLPKKLDFKENTAKSPKVRV